MGFLDILLLILIGIGVIAALRYCLHHRGCGGHCDTCAGCGKEKR